MTPHLIQAFEGTKKIHKYNLQGKKEKNLNTKHLKKSNSLEIHILILSNSKCHFLGMTFWMLFTTIFLNNVTVQIYNLPKYEH